MDQPSASRKRLHQAHFAVLSEADKIFSYAQRKWGNGMNRLQLATLISWAGRSGLQGRKRLQKVVFFLQEAGCHLDCRFTLHHFGPYSRDVADACDEIVAAGLVEERVEEQSEVKQYSYILTPAIQSMINEEADPDLQPFEELGRELIDPKSTHIWWLELGSTILFFSKASKSWDEAFAEACKFKKVEAHDKASQRAMELALRFRGLAVK